MDEVMESTDEGLTNDEVAKEVTAMNWPDKVDNLPASRLLPKYKALHKVLIHNLDPLTHRLDLSHERAIVFYKLGLNIALHLVMLIFEGPNNINIPIQVCFATSLLTWESIRWPLTDFLRTYLPWE